MNQLAQFKVDKATFYQFVMTHRDERYEFEDGFIVQQMTGGTFDHGRIASRFIGILLAQLDLSKWEILGERGVDTGSTVRYPDVVVEPTGADGKSLSTDRPALIVEILSPSSIARDLTRKPADYMAMPSLQAYIVASQDEQLCLVWARDVTGLFPDEPGSFGPNDAVDIEGLNLSVPISDIYRDIIFSPESSGHE